MYKTISKFNNSFRKVKVVLMKKKKCMILYPGQSRDIFRAAETDLAYAVENADADEIMAKKTRKIFVICPVRKATPEQEAEIREYISYLKKVGHSVYYPKDHTDQNDPRGLRICADNRTAISNADEIHVYWTGSEGALFDIGMAMAMEKPMLLINHEAKTALKFYNMESDKDDLDKIKAYKKSLGKTHRFDDENYAESEIKEVHLLWKSPPSAEMLFNLGVLFGSEITNVVLISEVKETPNKSFDNVVIDLAVAYAAKKA